MDKKEQYLRKLIKEEIKKVIGEDNTNQHKFYFEYYGWIPGYNDFDSSDITIKAKTQFEAWDIFNKKVKFAKSASLVSVDDVPYDEYMKDLWQKDDV